MGRFGAMSMRASFNMFLRGWQGHSPEGGSVLMYPQNLPFLIFINATVRLTVSEFDVTHKN